MRFAPQRRVILRHQNFRKCFQTLIFWYFHVIMCFPPQRRAIFQRCNFKKGVRHHHFFHIWSWKRAFRHSGVQFLISPLTSCLRARRFNRPTFRLIWHTNNGQNTAFRDFSNIWSRMYLLSSDFRAIASAFCWLDYSTLLFLCFSTLHIVGSLLFKLPWINSRCHWALLTFNWELSKVVKVSCKGCTLRKVLLCWHKISFCDSESKHVWRWRAGGCQTWRCCQRQT